MHSYEEAIHRYRDASIAINRKLTPYTSVYSISFELGFSLVLIVGGYFIGLGTLESAVFMAFLVLAICFYETSIPAKGTTALVGPSSGGKTTIFHLIARFWDVRAGPITIGDMDVRSMDSDELMKLLSFVFQDVYLFDDTVSNNIRRYGKPDATLEEVMEAARKARCHDFIMKLPAGYDSVVGEGGGLLSGGQRQRFSIARAILIDAPIVLLDEATASVDPDNERYIQEGSIRGEWRRAARIRN